jgi:hypothetical protein
MIVRMPSRLIDLIRWQRTAAAMPIGRASRKEMRQMKLRRGLTMLMMAFLLLGMGVQAAEARPPIRGCPPPFEGPLTFEQIIAKYPPPPEIPDPIAVLSRFDINEDRSLCVLDLPGGAFNAIDNVANVP